MVRGGFEPQNLGGYWGIKERGFYFSLIYNPHLTFDWLFVYYIFDVPKISKMKTKKFMIVFFIFPLILAGNNNEKLFTVVFHDI